MIYKHTSLDPQSKCSTNIVGWLIDQDSSSTTNPEGFPVVFLKGFAATQEHLTSEIPALRWKSHWEEETPAQQGANRRHDSKMARGTWKSDFTFIQYLHFS